MFADTADKASKKYELPESEGGGLRGATIASGVYFFHLDYNLEMF